MSLLLAAFLIAVLLMTLVSIRAGARICRDLREDVAYWRENFKWMEGLYERSAHERYQLQSDLAAVKKHRDNVLADRDQLRRKLEAALKAEQLRAEAALKVGEMELHLQRVRASQSTSRAVPCTCPANVACPQLCKRWAVEPRTAEDRINELRPLYLPLR
jgi:uncharacterized protein (DUF3084 family)